MIISAIKEIIVNDYKINWKSDWNDINTQSEIIKESYRLFRMCLYPTPLSIILKHKYKDVSIKIIVNNHNKFIKIKNEHPEYFDCIGNDEYVCEIKELFHLK